MWRDRVGLLGEASNVVAVRSNSNMLTRTPRQLCSGAQCTHRTLVRKMGMGFRGGAKPQLCQQDAGSDLPGEPLEAHVLSLAESTLNKVSFRGKLALTAAFDRVVAVSSQPLFSAGLPGPIPSWAIIPATSKYRFVSANFPPSTLAMNAYRNRIDLFVSGIGGPPGVSRGPRWVPSACPCSTTQSPSPNARSLTT